MNININNPVSIQNVLGTHVHHLCKPVINLTTGEVYASALDAAKILNVSKSTVSYACTGRLRMCKGYELRYVDHASGNINVLLAEIRKLYAENEQLRKDAKIGRYLRILANEEKAQKALEQARNERKRAEAKEREAELNLIKLKEGENK